MNWIQLPITDGKITIAKLVNLAFYKHIDPFGDGDVQSKLFRNDESFIVADIPFTSLLMQFEALTDWLSTETKLINLAFYTHIDPESEGTESRLYEIDDETSIVVAVTFDYMARRLRSFVGGVDLTGNILK